MKKFLLIVENTELTNDSKVRLVNSNAMNNNSIVVNNGVKLTISTSVK